MQAYQAVLSQYEIVVADVSHPRRREIEYYISHRYQQAFQATICEFMPYLVALFDDQQALVSVCGYRLAKDEPLFLEQYLSQPAEVLMSTHFQRRISRDSLIEFGQLASFSCGMAPVHFSAMIHLLLEQGYHWCIFTATGPLYAMMNRMGLKPHSLMDADPTYIADADAVWGRYYHSKPRVSAGNLEDGLAMINHRISRFNGQIERRDRLINPLSLQNISLPQLSLTDAEKRS
ncbi:thermostable hemolysin [Photobacterium sp.]|uniref:thermostable hemolysin n=1 Tax=Photobacterium sp. TaxID=660 RepID=UPI00299E7463|nr:thermostable hemolysin [Photobacterium sp.]MDX1302232.1 thermostable hemolysin [Photobacterium sp.]